VVKGKFNLYFYTLGVWCNRLADSLYEAEILCQSYFYSTAVYNPDGIVVATWSPFGGWQAEPADSSLNT
jgi:hypothetical protein